MQKPTRQQVIIGCVAGVAVAALGTLGVFAVLTGGFTHAAGQAPAQQSQQQSTQQSQQTTQKKDDSQAQSSQKAGGESGKPSGTDQPAQDDQPAQPQATSTGDAYYDSLPEDLRARRDSAIAAACATGKSVAYGTVVCTTVAERAAQVNYNVPEFASDNTALTLLVLDSPMTVTAYFGGQDGHTGQVTSICLPNDEAYRRYNGQHITIAVDNWGAFPSDIASKLYDIILGDRAGLEFVYPA